MDMMPALAPVPSLDDWVTCSFLEDSFLASPMGGSGIGSMDLAHLLLLEQLLDVRLQGIRSWLLVLESLELQPFRLQGIRSMPQALEAVILGIASTILRRC